MARRQVPVNFRMDGEKMQRLRALACNQGISFKHLMEITTDLVLADFGLVRHLLRLLPRQEATETQARE